MVYLRIKFLVLVLDMLNEHFSCFALNTHELKKKQKNFINIVFMLQTNSH